MAVCLLEDNLFFFVFLRGIEPVPPAVEVRSLNHWNAREVPENNL